MCGRFVQFSDPEIYASRYSLDTLCEAQPRYNLAPTQAVLAIRLTDTGDRELVRLRWGLVPAWSKGPDSRYKMINARAETVSTKPAFRNAFQRRRCLIPTEGFYEWQPTQTGKQPYFICRRDGEPFTMAGLWETWYGATDEPLQSCTIIVTTAGYNIQALHERMPVVLSPGTHDDWLDRNNQDTDGLIGLLAPVDADDWTLRAVSKRVNNPRYDGPELLEPIAAQPLQQLTNRSRHPG